MSYLIFRVVVRYVSAVFVYYYFILVSVAFLREPKEKVLLEPWFNQCSGRFVYRAFISRVIGNKSRKL